MMPGKLQSLLSHSQLNALMIEQSRLIFPKFSISDIQAAELRSQREIIRHRDMIPAGRLIVSAASRGGHR